MILKIMTSILVLFALSGSSVCLDHLYLGGGLKDHVINLDAGSKLPEENHQFSRSGFVTHRMPQPMALSPNMMIAQAKNLIDEAVAARNDSMSARDEVISVRDEAKARYDEATSLLAKIEDMEKNIESLVKRAELAAKASTSDAAQVKDFSNKTLETYNKTLSIYKEIDGDLGQIRSMLQEERDYSNASPGGSDMAKDNLNRSYQLGNETAVESGL